MTVKAKFSNGHMKSFQLFVDNIATYLRLQKDQRDRGEPRIDCKPGIYKRRCEVVKHIEEVKAGEKLTRKEMDEWTAMEEKLDKNIKKYSLYLRRRMPMVSEARRLREHERVYAKCDS